MEANKSVKIKKEIIEIGWIMKYVQWKRYINEYWRWILTYLLYWPISDLVCTITVNIASETEAGTGVFLHFLGCLFFFFDSAHRVYRVAVCLILLPSGWWPAGRPGDLLLEQNWSGPRSSFFWLSTSCRCGIWLAGRNSFSFWLTQLLHFVVGWAATQASWVYPTAGAENRQLMLSCGRTVCIQMITSTHYTSAVGRQYTEIW